MAYIPPDISDLEAALKAAQEKFVKSPSVETHDELEKPKRRLIRGSVSRGSRSGRTAITNSPERKSRVGRRISDFAGGSIAL